MGSVVAYLEYVARTDHEMRLDMECDEPALPPKYTKVDVLALGAPLTTFVVKPPD